MENLESWKAYNLLKEGARNIVQSAKPEIGSKDLEDVLTELFTVCEKHRDSTELTGCLYSNLEKAYEKVVESG